ncbi:MAG: Na+/H+ antiporter subunit E [Methylacidiphilales bacterium]|nr:Na+/H+ antiporter subunit E [Candidatus Methylacidiphilales bacterium]MDW8349579.1 Na+/H+ antiporter subunit E [Verrucomicrobiae bacterium]
MKILLSLNFLLFYLQEFLLSNLRVAKDVLSPHPQIAPDFIELPLDLQNDVAIFLLANLITMTPGTLTVDLSEDKKTLLIHSIYVHDPVALKLDLKQNFERRIARLFT